MPGEIDNLDNCAGRTVMFLPVKHILTTRQDADAGGHSKMYGPHYNPSSHPHSHVSLKSMNALPNRAPIKSIVKAFDTPFANQTLLSNAPSNAHGVHSIVQGISSIPRGSLAFRVDPIAL